MVEKKAFFLEKDYIKSIGRKDLNKGPLLNLCDGGKGNNNYIVKNEAKKIRSKKMLGNIPFNKGMIHSDETKKKISIANKGMIHSDETKKKISIAKVGSKILIYKVRKKFRHTEETKRKISESKKGKSSGNKGKIYTIEFKKKLSNIHKTRLQGKSAIKMTSTIKNKIGKSNLGNNNGMRKKANKKLTENIKKDIINYFLYLNYSIGKISGILNLNYRLIKRFLLEEEIL